MWTTEPVDALLTCARRVLHVREVVPVSDQPTRANERANTDAVSITYPARPALGPGPRLWDPTFLTLRAPMEACNSKRPLGNRALCPLPFVLQNHRISSPQSQNLTDVSNNQQAVHAQKFGLHAGLGGPRCLQVPCDQRLNCAAVQAERCWNCRCSKGMSGSWCCRFISVEP